MQLKVALWQDLVGSVSLNKSYKFINFAVKKFDDIVTIYTPRKDALIEDIEDIIGTKVIQPTTKTLEKAKIIGVTNLSSVHACVSCKNGQVMIMDKTLGKCSLCPTTMLIEIAP